MHIVMSSLEFMHRLAALVPRPHSNFHPRLWNARAERQVGCEIISSAREPATEYLTEQAHEQGAFGPALGETASTSVTSGEAETIGVSPTARF